MKMKSIFLIVLMTGLSAMLSAQSNEQLDRFMAQDKAPTADSLLLIAQAVGDLDAQAEAEDAMAWARKQKWGKKFKKIKGDSPVKSGLFHLALFKSFGIKGGWAFKMTPTARTAALEAGYQGFTMGQPYVNHQMSPDEVLYSLSAALERQEDAP